MQNGAPIKKNMQKEEFTFATVKSLSCIYKCLKEHKAGYNPHGSKTKEFTLNS